MFLLCMCLCFCSSTYILLISHYCSLTFPSMLVFPCYRVVLLSKCLLECSTRLIHSDTTIIPHIISTLRHPPIMLINNASFKLLCACSPHE